MLMFSVYASFECDLWASRLGDPGFVCLLAILKNSKRLLCSCIGSGCDRLDVPSLSRLLMALYVLLLRMKSVSITAVALGPQSSHIPLWPDLTLTPIRFFPARQSLTRPKSFVSTRLLSLEEAQARSQAPLLLQGSSHPLQDRFHTVLDLPTHRWGCQIQNKPCLLLSTHYYSSTTCK